MRSHVVAVSQLFLIVLYVVLWFYNTINHREWWLIIFLPFSVVTLMFPINYCVNNVISLFASGKWCRQNSKYYWIIPEPDLEQYPDITIQIPIYKEDFYQVILPTLSSAILTRYEYKGKCNIVVLDDGYAFQSAELQDLKMTYYHNLKIAMIARPQSPRLGKFKKASNLNNHFRLVCETPVQRDSNQIILGDYSIGEYIVLIDSDSRIDHQVQLV